MLQLTLWIYLCVPWLTACMQYPKSTHKCVCVKACRKCTQVICQYGVGAHDLGNGHLVFRHFPQSLLHASRIQLFKLGHNESFPMPYMRLWRKRRHEMDQSLQESSEEGSAGGDNNERPGAVFWDVSELNWIEM